MTINCNCVNIHYSTEHYFQIHGDYLGKIPFKVQIPFLNDGALFGKNKLNPTQEYPLLIYKWVCKYCGRQRATGDINTHEKDCEYSKYLTFIVGSDTTFAPATVEIPITTPKPTELPASEIKKLQDKINNIRTELEGIFVISDADKGKNNRVFFEKEFDKIERVIKLDKNNIGKAKQIISYLVNWEEWEQKLEPAKIYPDKKRKPLNWYLLGKLS